MPATVAIDRLRKRIGLSSSRRHTLRLQHSTKLTYSSRFRDGFTDSMASCKDCTRVNWCETCWRRLQRKQVGEINSERADGKWHTKVFISRRRTTVFMKIATAVQVWTMFARQTTNLNIFCIHTIKECTIENAANRWPQRWPDCQQHPLLALSVGWHSSGRLSRREVTSHVRLTSSTTKKNILQLRKVLFSVKLRGSFAESAGETLQHTHYSPP